jgi:hypothetical protein
VPVLYIGRTVPSLLTASAFVFSACISSWYTVALYSKYCRLVNTAYFKIYMHRFAPHLKHPWKTKFDGAQPVTVTCFSSTHVEEVVFVGSPSCQHVVNGATQRGFTASLQAKNRKQVHFIASCICVSHSTVVNCDMCGKLPCVWKFSVKLFRNNVLSLCVDSLGFPVKMYIDYYTSLRYYFNPKVKAKFNLEQATTE